ncbi:MAG: hypothetical protein OEM60_08285 [Gammaproteobacteria bacterium]|nr:hypothetical protein [Gammaproteobacteria bacterium]
MPPLARPDRNKVSVARNVLPPVMSIPLPTSCRLSAGQTNTRSWEVLGANPKIIDIDSGRCDAPY